MRIAIIVDTFPSISETFISEKVLHLSERGHDVGVFCSKFNSKSFHATFAGILGVTVRVFSSWPALLYAVQRPAIVIKSFFSKPVFNRLYRSYRIKLINDFKPDIIHFEFSGIGIDYMRDFSLLVGKKVVSCRGSAEKVKLLIYKERQHQFRELLQRVDGIHCVSCDMRATVMPYCKEPGKIFINYPSINTSFFRTAVLRRHRKHLIILSVGRMTFQKGYSQGLLVMHLLKQKGAVFTWLIVGGGDYKEEVLFKTKELQLSDEVVFAGSKTRNEVKQLMEEADIYYLPSVYEGIANVALEAMSMCLPVVSTDCGGMKEVLENAVNGFIADVHNYEQQAVYLYQLWADEALRNEIGNAARRRVLDQFCIQQQTDVYEREYLELLQSKKSLLC